MKNSFFVLIFFSFFFTDLSAQVYSTQYRLPGLDWQEVRSDHFRVIYPANYRDEAIRSLSILEAEYSDIKSYIGGELRNFPFILNPENDRSNGFVSPVNFRSEVEIAPIRGKTLNPQSGDWLESVLPHELVHALHLSVNPPSVTRFLSLFSPDLRRSVHGAVPLGLHEGIAVDYESHGTIPNSGRGNYPFFTHQFNSLLETDAQWSMGQLLHTTDYTPPFNRHYVGGYEFMNWLKNSYGDDTAKNSIEFQYKYPFLGYGVALRAETGKWPSQLYREFSDDVIDQENRRHQSTEESEAISEITLSGTCRRANRPVWLNESTLLFHVRFCNQPSGFYRYDLTNLSVDHLLEIQVSEDYFYSLSSDSTEILFSRHHSDLLYDNVFRGDIHSLNIDSGVQERLTVKQRLFSPTAVSDKIYALQTEGQAQNLVHIDSSTGEIFNPFKNPENGSIIQFAPNPVDQSRSAVIGKVNGVQGVWFVDTAEETELLTGAPDIVFESGSIFDLNWHPSGEKFLFVSDEDGAMNIYEYDVTSDRLFQLTREPFNIFEPAYSPDGTSVAFIKQFQNEHIPAVAQIQSFQDEEIPSSRFRAGEFVLNLLERPLMNRESLPDTTGWNFKEYRTGLGWLKPRLWLPTYENQNDNNRIGISLQSVDQLNSRHYQLDMSYYLDRIWYDLEYTYKGFYPGFRVNVFNEPNLTAFRVTQNDQEFIEPVLQQSRGASLKIPFRFYLERNTRFTTLLIEPQYYISQLRFWNPNQTNTAYSEFGTRHSIGLAAVLSYRLRQFTRDVQPNAGWVFFAESRVGLNRTDLNIRSDSFNIDANLSTRRGFRGYISTFVSPLSKWNQSLRLTGQVVTQTDIPVFNTASLYSDSFSEVPLPAVNNAAIFNTRYTIPIIYPDDGGLTLPVYLSNVYLVLFSQTVSDLNQSDLYDASRSVYGAGIRSRFRISNLAFDIGISIGWEPTRNEVTYHIGSF